MAMRPIALLRSSFGLKLLVALLACVGVVLLLALVVVRRETERQVERVAERMAARSREAFRDLEALKRLELERLGSAFTESRRTLAAVEAAAEAAVPASELEWLIQTVRYELELKRMPHSLVVFTDAHARPLITLRDGDVVPGTDPVDVALLARRLLETGAENVGAYRALGGQLFALQVRPLALAGAAVGTVALGLPVDDAEAQRVGDVLGVELCFVVGDGCLAGTPVARARLETFLPAADARRITPISAGGERWRVLAEELTPDQPGVARRIVAVPMNEVLAPFERIRGALGVAGTVALGLALLLGATLSRELTGPVRDLVAATARVAGGDYAARVPIRSSDELGRLASAFNTMTEGLEQKERYRGLLDKVVSPEVAEELLRSEIQLGGETREVTTLFVDVSSFTPLTEGMEPQRVVLLVNELMSRLGTIVETHGGVVDKYLGDGLMALFGAPVARGDDATRAVRAALEMQQAMTALDATRTARGESAVRVAIGIHTGAAVAGNIGSPNRLNYTAVGESVNLAARLCQGAGAGVILVTDAVRSRARGEFTFERVGERTFKGFSRAVEVFAVRPPDGGAAAGSVAAATTSGGVVTRLGAVAFLGWLLVCAATPAPGMAQGGALPTLADLGLGYRSADGGFQLDLSGRLDVEGYLPQDRPQWVIAATDPFLAGRVRLFADLFAGDALYGLLEIRADRGEAPDDAPLEARVEQAFARVALPLPAGLQLQAGKFASPIGGYPARHHTSEDPLIRPPVMYDYHTIIDPAAAPGAAAGFLDWKDDPVRRPAGTPIVWGVPYPWGALLAGVAGAFDFRFGLTSTAPSSRPGMWDLDRDRFSRASLVAGAGWRVVPELRVQAYFSRGSYLDELRQGVLPAGAELDDFFQELWGAELVFARGPATVRAEGFANRWNVPNVGDDVRDLSYSVESKVKLAAGLFAAARYGAIHFNELDAAGRSESWDHDVRRIQIGAGYRLLRNTELRAEYLVSRTDGADPRDNLLSLQWWWEF